MNDEVFNASIAAIWRHFALQEALASVSIDKGGTVTTVPFTHYKDRDTPGFGCPGCGTPFESLPSRDLIVGTLSCCGQQLDGPHSVRLLKAREILES